MEIATTPQSVAPQAPQSDEAQFQSLFDAGAFEPKKLAEQEAQRARDEQGKFAKTEPEVKAPEVKAEEVKEPEVKTEVETEQTEEEKAEEYAHLDELLKSKGIDPESVRNLPVTVKIDGEERQVSLSEVLKSYQLEGHVNKKSIDLSEQQKAFAAERDAGQKLVAQQLQQNRVLGDLAMQELTNEYSRLDWNGLRATNPAEYAAKQVEFQQRHNSIQNYLQQVQGQQSAAEQQRQADQSARVEAEKSRMFDKHPEWKDPTAFASARDKITSYAKTLGFSDAELAQVSDHRLMDLLHDAASFRALQAAKPEALKQVRAAPKMGKPGTRNVTDPSQVARKAAVDRFNANPHDIDAQVALFDALG